MKFRFQQLEVYQKSIAFVKAIYKATRDFPNQETFGLTSQLRRAAVSISINIAEGSARSKKDFCRFIDIARGSNLECVAILEITHQENYINSQVFEKFEDDLIRISKMLSSLKKSLSG